jgi:hypothetical protein
MNLAMEIVVIHHVLIVALLVKETVRMDVAIHVKILQKAMLTLGIKTIRLP